ncbi:hypothetical protein NC99_02140 [Sunxiuqinia dokdonensis]|uniref:Uncharacterized protein n=1 Tax=Sunxiuqinia dokdonensis TaxID=1409788 RepID=A0A0L8VER8_9BACT|nr:hypothetical protein NC99_02140 [Sunxiuqinia dokdonensis]
MRLKIFDGLIESGNEFTGIFVGDRWIFNNFKRLNSQVGDGGQACFSFKFPTSQFGFC